MLCGMGYKVKTVNANFKDQKFREDAILRSTNSVMIMGWCKNTEQGYIQLHIRYPPGASGCQCEAPQQQDSLYDGPELSDQHEMNHVYTRGKMLQNV